MHASSKSNENACLDRTPSTLNSKGDDGDDKDSVLLDSPLLIADGAATDAGPSSTHSTTGMTATGGVATNESSTRLLGDNGMRSTSTSRRLFPSDAATVFVSFSASTFEFEAAARRTGQSNTEPCYR
jgi:hypothetical protein